MCQLLRPPNYTRERPKSEREIIEVCSKENESLNILDNMILDKTVNAAYFSFKKRFSNSVRKTNSLLRRCSATQLQMSKCNGCW